MSEAMLTLFAGMLSGTLVSAIAGIFFNVRKNRLDTNEDVRREESHEVDLVATMRAAMQEDWIANRERQEAMQQEIDLIRREFRMLESELLRYRDLLREAASYISALFVHIAQHARPNSPSPAPPGRRLQAFLDADGEVPPEA